MLCHVSKNDVTCESCILRCYQLTAQMCWDSSVTKLVTLKEYSSDSLVYCSQAMFDLMVSAEILFRQLQQSFMASKSNVKEQLMAAVNRSTADHV